MNTRRQAVPGVGLAFLLVGCPLLAAGALWTTVMGSASADRIAIFLLIAMFASLLFAFTVARLRGIPIRRCLSLLAVSAAASLGAATIIGVMLVVAVD